MMIFFQNTVCDEIDVFSRKFPDIFVLFFNQVGKNKNFNRSLQSQKSILIAL